MPLVKGHKGGFTLMELMIVIAIIGILVTALFPTYNSYIQRGRDVVRISDLDNLTKKLTLYYSENERYPVSDAGGCLDNNILANYNGGENILDPDSSHYNGCNTLGKYGYAMSTGILSNPKVYALLAFTEQRYGGNYSGSVAGFTGVLSAAAYGSGISPVYSYKGAGPYLIRIP